MNGFTRLHDVALLRAPPLAVTRPPRSAEVVRRAPPTRIFAQPSDARPWKWWAVEVRFDRPLTRGEARAFGGVFAAWDDGGAGEDGASWDQWWNKYPGEYDDGMLLDAMRRAGVPGCVRAVPFGRDCPGGIGCPLAFGADRHRCRVGDVFALHPTFTDADWIGVDASRVETP